MQDSATTANVLAKQLLWLNQDQNASIGNGTNDDLLRSAHIFAQRKTRAHHRPPRKVYDSIVFRIEKQTASESHDDDLARQRTSTSGYVRGEPLPNNNRTPGSAYDPFMVSIVPAADPVHNLIQYSHQCILNGAGGHKTEAFVPHLRPFDSMYIAAADLSMSYIVQYEHVLYPMMAAFTQRLRCRQQYPFTNLYNPERYMQVALMSVRKALSDVAQSNNNSDNHSELMRSIATGVSFLAFAACLSGRVLESYQHIQGLLQISGYLDASKITDKWLLDNTACFDIVHSAQYRTIPTAELETNTFVSFPGVRETELKKFARDFKAKHLGLRTDSTMSIESEKTRNLSSAIFMKFDLMLFPQQDLEAGLGASLEKALEFGQIDTRIQPVLEEILACLDIARLIWHNPGLTNSRDSSWLCHRAKATLKRLLIVVANNPFDDGTQEGRFSKCLAVVLTIVMEGAFHRMLHLTCDKHVERLRCTLQNLLSNIKDGYSSDPSRRTTQNYEGALLWITITGCWAGQFSIWAEWFVDQAVGLASHLGLRSHDEIHQVMAGYLYSKTVQYECVARIADRLYTQC